jgi:general secretion pathway protein D
MIDVGTANALSLRHSGSKAATPASSVAPAPASQSAPSQSAPVAAPQQQTPAPQGPAAQNLVPQNQAGAGAGTFMFDPPTLSQAKGSTFTVNVMLSGGQNVYSVPVQLNYDPNQLAVVNVSNGGFLSQDGQAVALVHRDDPATGTLQITATRPPGAGGVSGQGAVVTLTFMAKGQGQSALTITRGGARDPAMQPIAMSGAQAAITIQ